MTGFKSPSQLFEDASIKYMRATKADKRTPWDLLYQDGYDHPIYREYRAEMMLLYVSISRARFEVEINYI